VSRLSRRTISHHASAGALLAGAVLASTSAIGQSLGYAQSAGHRSSPFEQIMSEYRIIEGSPGAAEVPANLRRRVVAYQTREAPGTVIVDTPNTQLFYILGGGKAISYGIGVGRDGFTWSGVQTIARKSEWPDWIPPADMLARQPYLPRFMAGGPGNPLGARALYLGNSIYRIHGTNAPETIGARVSSGCIRMLNDDVIDVYARVSVGTKVVVLPDRPRPGTAVLARASSVPEVRPVASSGRPVRAVELY
jgi:lipoprotein-anchoring transpeptidase ErfK/SrfK